jgi:hypothetical protein
MTAFRRIINVVINEAVWPFVLFLFALAIAIFLYGLVEFIVAADNEERRAKGKKHLTWGIIGLFIMFAVWGIIEIILNFVSAIGG